jgi:hypothetical protein
MPAYFDSADNLPEINETSPSSQLKYLAEKWKMNIYSEEFSHQLDKCNYWPHYRERFHYPKLKDLPNGIFTYNLP